MDMTAIYWIVLSNPQDTSRKKDLTILITFDKVQPVHLLCVEFFISRLEGTKKVHVFNVNPSRAGKS